MRKLIFFIIIFCLPFLVLAKDISSNANYILDDKEMNSKINDENENTYVNVKKEQVININAKENISRLYIIYELSSKEGTIKGNDKSLKIGKNGYLHDYIDIEKEIGKTKELTIVYDEDVKIAEIYVLDNGETPDFVEIWDTPCSAADLLLFSTHSDDEQLFFLGLLPTYVAKGANVQVVYFTNHNDNPKRLHEQLHGLYAVGIRHYPIIGIIPDAYSESLEGAINNLKKANLTEEDALQFEVENLRRFKPLVVVGHDELGEYSHGQHILNTHVLEDAIIKANDKTYDETSFKKYGVWDTPKTYLHLYKENQITMNYDTPLDYFGGKTAYEVSKIGYSKHNSQQWTWFTKWINGKNNEYTKATDIKTYSPVEFGLYRTTVGEDKEKNDMFENLTFRKDQKPEINDDGSISVSFMNSTTGEKKLDIRYIIIGICLFIIIVLGLRKVIKKK